MNIGAAHIQLGTPTAKVRATNFYTFSLLEKLQSQLTLATGTTTKLAYVIDRGEAKGPQLKVAAPDRALFATVSNSERLAQPNAKVQQYYVLGVGAVKAGLLSAPIFRGPNAPLPRIVTTPAELVAATAKGQEAVLVYRLNAADLRNLKLTPVPANTLHPVP